MITAQTLEEARSRMERYQWARAVFEQRRQGLEPWMAASAERLAQVFPTRRANVYHNFSCPNDHARLTFDPFEPSMFTCPVCARAFPAETDAGIYPVGDRYHGTMYDGWACLFYQIASGVTRDLAVIGRIEHSDRYLQRAADLLLLFARTLRGLTVEGAGWGPGPKQSAHLLTYGREGDNKILFDLAQAYELLRDTLTPDQREQAEADVLGRLLDDVMLEPYYPYDHNNVYQWYRTILQTAAALQRDDLVDWCFGYAGYDAAHLPQHRSLARIVEEHFFDDGAFWELCSGYHLYPLFHFCELAILSHHLSQMDPERFPAVLYDCTSPYSSAGRAIRNALHWFMAMAMPDRTMPTVGDSTAPRAGMQEYYMTAEVGYRYFDLLAVGDYEDYRQGRRTWDALLFGAPEIQQHDLPYTSSYLSSGWVSLRNEWQGNRVWIGLNALLPGGGHQHADRLTFLSYSHGELLALEKATPYNEQTTRVLGTLTPSHNTVVVDGQSQKQGEDLGGEEIPRVVFVHDGPLVKFAEIHADHLYPQTTLYRRSVALIEDIAVDVFQVQGGKQHDWIVHHAGGPPQLSLQMEQDTFEPGDWLYNGAQRVLSATAPGDWWAQWQVGEVTSRLTMLGASGATVYALQTYPIDNAVITGRNPPCQTLCVRRPAEEEPFTVVWDSWRAVPNLQSVSRDASGLITLHTRSHRYCLRFGPLPERQEDPAPLATDAAFSVVRDHDAVTMVWGTWLTWHAPEGTLCLRLNRPATLSAVRVGDRAQVRLYNHIQFDTRGGENLERPVPQVEVSITGNLWERSSPPVLLDAPWPFRYTSN